MSRIETRNWRHTSPLAVIFYVGKVLRFIAQNLVQSLAPLVALLFAYRGDLMGMITAAAVAFIVVLLIVSFLRYLFFRYRITNDAVLIREGVIRKTQLDIKFERIQAINTTQNIVYRMFGLVTVTFDTAGSKGQEGHLPAVTPDLAQALREKIRRAGHDSDQAEAPDDAHSPAVRELLSLGNTDMIRIGLSDNRSLIFLAFLGPLFEQLDTLAGRLISEDNLFALLAMQAGFREGAALVLVLVVGIALLLVLASIAGAFLRFHRFHLVESNDVYQSTGGLLTRHEHSINRAKIQDIVTSQNLFLRWFGRFRLSVRQATSSKQRHIEKKFMIPICLPAESNRLAIDFLGGEYPALDTDPKSPSFHPIAFQYVRSRTMLTAVIPCMAVTTPLMFVIGWHALWILLWIPAYALVNWQRYRRYGVQVSRDGLALRKGFIGYRITSFVYRKVQRVGITQTVFQKRKGLATLRFYLASGTVRIPYVSFRDARRLRDYVLFKVESSRLAWH